MPYPWLRLWNEFATDPKWRTIARVSDQPLATVIAAAACLMIDANMNATERGRTKANADELASTLDIAPEAAQDILAAFESRFMNDGWIVGWAKRQPRREDGSAVRARIWRERRQQANGGERKRTKANAGKRPDTDRDIKENKQKKASDADAEFYSADFEAWWSTYPNRKGKSRAYKLWKKIPGSRWSELATATANYAAECAGTNRQYVKHGDTFLGEWTDYRTVEPPPAAEPITMYPEYKPDWDINDR